MKQAKLYWIKLPDYRDITQQGYVGVTTTINRICRHKHALISRQT